MYHADVASAFSAGQLDFVGVPFLLGEFTDCYLKPAQARLLAGNLPTAARRETHEGLPSPKRAFRKRHLVARRAQAVGLAPSANGLQQHRARAHRDRHGPRRGEGSAALGRVGAAAGHPAMLDALDGRAERTLPELGAQLA